MKKLPLLIGLLLLALAIALMVYSAGAQGSLHDLLVRMDKDNLADSDSKMQKARDRVTEALLAGYGLIGKAAPNYVAWSALPVSKANLEEAWQQVYHKPLPDDVKGVME